MGWLSRLKSNLSIKKITQNVLLPAVGAAGVQSGNVQPAQPTMLQGVLPQGRENIYLFGGLALVVVILIVVFGRKRR